MTSNSTTPCLPQSETETAVHLFDSWFDPIEAGLRDRVRDFLHAMFEGELDILLSRPRYGRRGLDGSNGSGESGGASGHRHGHRPRSLMGSFGQVEIAVPLGRPEQSVD
jgi:putative transposase